MEWDSIFPPASEDQIAGFERATGIVLPPLYRDFLHSTNGGSPQSERRFVVDESDEVMLGALYGIAEDGGALNLKSVYDDLREWEDFPHEMLPIGEDPGGNRLLLATRGENKERIDFWDRVGFIAQRKGRRIFPVAANINALLAGLR